MDLDLEHYSYADLLNLFELPSPYTRDQWKQASTVVNRMHPDKSGLPGAYFDFFRRAHAMLGSALQTRGVRTDVDDLLGVAERRKIASMSKNEFAGWFNQTFDELCRQEDQGYGEWLSGNDGVVSAAGSQDVHAYFKDERAKGTERAQLATVDLGGGYDTMGSDPTGYSAPLFSSLQYDDIRAAHTQTFVPVDDTDFQQANRIETVEERAKTRSGAIRMLSEREALESLQQSQTRDSRGSMGRHYRLAQELQRSEDAQRQIKGRLLALPSKRT